MARRTGAKLTTARLTVAESMLYAHYGPRPSAQRAQAYATLDKRALLALPVAQLANPSGCLVLVWITNSRHVQDFVERVLFPRWGARRLACWYWLKVTADGQLAGGSPRSPHRKPWEPLLIGFIGSGAPPPLPPRRVICSVPLGHSHKPPLCAPLSPVTENQALMKSHPDI